ncbi:MAG TPA: hypothetical protein VKC15_20840 [Gemmatimonadales bacterium]|nr:hypothetical protein [Gemmatimonadales bacterium]
MSREHVVIARAIVALLIGGLLGYAVGTSLAGDSRRGRELTMKQYVADFDRYKAKLEKSEMPMTVAVISGVIMVAAVFGVYELLAFGLAKALAAITRPRSPGAPPDGLPPPPWTAGRS